MPSQVVHVTTVHRQRDNRIFEKECRALSDAGYAVSLIAQGIDSVVDGISIKGIRRRTSRLARMLFAPVEAFRKVLALRANVVHIHDPELLPVAGLLKLKGLKVVYDSHEDLPRQIAHKEYLPLPVRRLMAPIVEAFENSIVRRLDAVVAATETIGHRFERINPRTIVVHNFPRDGEITADSWESKKASACYVGMMTASRGMMEMLDAIEKIHVPLVLAGPIVPDALQKKCMVHRGWRHVDYRGVVDRKGISDLLSSCKVGLSCLHPEPQYLVSHPTKMYEYMSAGIPIVVSDFPLWRRIVERYQCGICVNPFDPTAIADAVSYLLSHDDEARKMGANGRRAVEQVFNWDQEASKLVGLYASFNDALGDR